MIINKKSASGLIFVAIIIILISVLAYFEYMAPPTYKVEFKGTISKSITGEWDIEHDGYEIDKDNYLPFWFWETGSVVVETTLYSEQDGSKYQGKINLGSMLQISDSRSYVCTIHNIPRGTYYGEITVYEVFYSWFGFKEEGTNTLDTFALDNIEV